MSEELRWIWTFGPNPVGPYSEAELREKIRHHAITPETLYWSERLQQWREIRGMKCEDHEERLAEMRRTGVKRVEFADSGKGDDCRICSELADKRFTILDAPSLPPKGCDCEPWCCAKVIAVQ